MSEDHKSVDDNRRFNANFIELAIRLGLIGFLVYWTFVLVQPFATIMVWSVVLVVALYPAFSAVSRWLGGRPRLAAALIALLGLMLVIGPATWMGVGIVEALKTLIAQIDSGEISIPPPPAGVKDWPLVGDSLYSYWRLASSNFSGALANLLPQLKPVGEVMLETARSAGAGTLKFLASIIIAGFLFIPGPQLLATTRTLARRINPTHGEKYVELAGATIHAVSRGVMGIALMQAVLGGVGMTLANVPGASLLTAAILVLGIIQIGPLIVVAPVVVWAWANLPPASAIGLTICMLTVNFMDNVLKPILLSRGLTTPMLVIFIGVIGGVLTNGIAGLFVGPVILAVAWGLANAWIVVADEEPGDAESGATRSAPAQRVEHL